MHHSNVCCGVKFPRILYIEPTNKIGQRGLLCISVLIYGASQYYLFFDIFVHSNQMQYGRHSVRDGSDPAAGRCGYIPRPGQRSDKGEEAGCRHEVEHEDGRSRGWASGVREGIVRGEAVLGWWRRRQS